MKQLFAALLTFVIAGCTTPAYQPQEILSSGPYTQTSSGITFPQTIGIFRRIELVSLNEQTSHLYAGYNSELIAQPIIVSTFVYPEPTITSIGSPPEVIASARQQLWRDLQEQQKHETLAAHPGGMLVSESRATLVHRGQSVPGLRVDYVFNEPFQGQVQQINSTLYLFDLGKHILKFRVSAPIGVDSAEPVEKLIVELASSVPPI